MIVFLVRRLLLAAFTVVTVSFGAFLAFGKGLDPSYPLVLGAPKIRHAVQAHYHLTDPILSRYWRWVRGFFQHGFGNPVWFVPPAGLGTSAKGVNIGVAKDSTTGAEKYTSTNQTITAPGGQRPFFASAGETRHPSGVLSVTVPVAA